MANRRAADRPAPQDRREDAAEAKRQIPHFTYVEEVDVTELEALRAQLNAATARSAAS
jgi:pyruvate/2-oxoglutarate dehydrogenase complex dihydrolipoamide acyltransferase (E2) component